jgi:hypothetical protein
MSNFGEFASAASTLAVGSGAGLFSSKGVAVGSASYVVIPPLAMLKMVTERFEYLSFTASTHDSLLAPAPAGVDEPITTQLPGATSGAADGDGAGVSTAGGGAGATTGSGAGAGAGATTGSGAGVPPPPPPQDASRANQANAGVARQRIGPSGCGRCSAPGPIVSRFRIGAVALELFQGFKRAGRAFAMPGLRWRALAGMLGALRLTCFGLLAFHVPHPEFPASQLLIQVI